MSLADPGAQPGEAEQVRDTSALTSSRDSFWRECAAAFELMDDSTSARTCHARGNAGQASAESLLAAAENSIHLTQYEEASDYIDQVLRLAPRSGPAWQLRGTLRLCRGDPRAAFDCFQNALSYLSAAEANDSFLWFSIGVVYDELASWVQAQEAYSSALKLGLPAHLLGELHLRLAYVHVKTGHIAEATACFETALADLPAGVTPTDVQVELARLCAVQGRWADARAQYEAILASAGDFVPALQDFACLLLSNTDMFDPAAAEAVLERALARDGENGKSLCLFARAKMCPDAKGRLRDARGAYKALQLAVRVRPGMTPAWCLLATLYCHSAKLADAFECYRTALRLAPDSADIWWNVAVLYASVGMAADASQAFAKARALEDGQGAASPSP